MEDGISIRKLLQVMVEQDASDLYLMAGAPPGYRIQGVIKRMGKENFSPVIMDKLAAQLMTEKQKVEFSNCMEMNLSAAFVGMGRFRVNVYRQRGSIGMVIRQITTEIPSVDDLKLPEVFKSIAMAK
jgi:twitching motility protein PilU